MGLPVVAHADIVVIDDVANGRAQWHGGQQLVHLLLVLRENHTDLGALNRTCNFCRRGIGKQRHHHTTEPLHSSHRGKQARAVLTEQTYVVATLHTHGRQTGRQHTHFISQRTPRHRLPNTATFFAHGCTLRARLGVVEEKLRKSVHPQLLCWAMSALRQIQQAPQARSARTSHLQGQNELS